VRLIGFLRAHVDSVVAVALAIGYLIEISQSDASAIGPPFSDLFEVDETAAIAASIAFLFSLALRSRLPLVPLALAYVAMAASGGGQIDGVLTMAAGVLLAVYSVGAWAGGRAG